MVGELQVSLINSDILRRPKNYIIGLVFFKLMVLKHFNLIAGVNHVLIFELDPRNHLSYQVAKIQNIFPHNLSIEKNILF